MIRRPAKRAARAAKTMRLGLALAAGILSMLIPGDAWGQEAPPSQADWQLCGGAAFRHGGQHRRLMVMRDARASPGTTVSPMTIGSASVALAGRIREGNLPARTRVLFFTSDGPSLVACLIGPDGLIASSSQVSAAEIAPAAARLRESMDVDALQRHRAPRQRGQPVPQPVGANGLSFETARSAVSRLIFPEALREHLQGIEHLIVVPTGAIATLPFAALDPFGDGRAMVDFFSVSVAPSLASLHGTAPRWNPATAFERPLVVGDPRLPFSAGWLVPPLPGAEAEARDVAAQLGTEPLIGEAATRQAVIGQAGAASLLYFATHGTANSIDPLNGGFLMLSAPTLEEGWWTARDVQSARLSAQLAVLSACQTGLGQVHDAGTIGLARAFQLAGVPRVVMSLWSVDDAATALLMSLFLRRAASHPPAQALRLAMLETRATHPDPALWASFLLFGVVE